MNSSIPLENGLRANFVQVLNFVFLYFGLLFLYSEYSHKVYLTDYENNQIQQEQEVSQKITTTIRKLKILANVMGKSICSASDDSQKIQAILAAGIKVSRNYDVPDIQHITYCKISDSKEIITPSMIITQSCISEVFDKPAEELESLATKDNKLIGTIPIYDQQTRLKGVLEISVPFVDMQKFIGVDKMTTLEFPKLFDNNGKQLIQDDLFNFSFKAPLLYSEYLLSYRSHFPMLFFMVALVVLFLVLSTHVIKKHTTLAYKDKMKRLSQDMDNLLSSHKQENARYSSLETYNSIQRRLIQRFKEMTSAIYKSVKHVGDSYNESVAPLVYEEKLTLINAAAGLAEDLSCGIYASLKKEPIKMIEILDQVKSYFDDIIHQRNITFHITCPEDLVFVEDPLFTQIVFLNVIGHPICSMPYQGKISIDVTQNGGFIHLEVQDNRYHLSTSAQPYLKHLFELSIGSSALRQICLQNGLSYESFKKEKGQFYTHVTLPLDSTLAENSNIVRFKRLFTGS